MLKYLQIINLMRCVTVALLLRKKLLKSSRQMKTNRARKRMFYSKWMD